MIRLLPDENKDAPIKLSSSSSTTLSQGKAVASTFTKLCPTSGEGMLNLNLSQ